jgi:hypothetical protein
MKALLKEAKAACQMPAQPIFSKITTSPVDDLSSAMHAN